LGTMIEDKAKTKQRKKVANAAFREFLHRWKSEDFIHDAIEWNDRLHELHDLVHEHQDVLPEDIRKALEDLANATDMRHRNPAIHNEVSSVLKSAISITKVAGISATAAGAIVVSIAVVAAIGVYFAQDAIVHIIPNLCPIQAQEYKIPSNLAGIHINASHDGYILIHSNFGDRQMQTPALTSVLWNGQQILGLDDVQPSIQAENTLELECRT